MFPVILQYDMRAPEWSVPAERLYAAALEQCVWADKLGFPQVTLMEHHASDDGYLPSPLVMGGAVAGCTKNVLISLSLLVLPLYDPIRLAEDIAVLDLLSGGRVRPIVGAGYRAEEFALFGKELKQRPRLMEEGIEILKKAWTGEPFEYRGQTVRILPRPFQKPRPPITMGGSSRASAERAARIADNYYPTHPKFYEIYLEELKKLGKPAPKSKAGPNSGVMSVQISENPDAEWQRVGRYFMHDMNEYGRWTGGQGGFKEVSSIEDLRATGIYRVLTPEECVSFAKEFGYLTIKPLVGGMPPELAWESLRLLESKVLPKLA